MLICQGFIRCLRISRARFTELLGDLAAYLEEKAAIYKAIQDRLQAEHEAREAIKRAAEAEVSPSPILMCLDVS